MAQAGSILSLLVGASLFGVATRLAFPPAAWIGLAALVHASRSIPAMSGATFLWLALYASLAIANRDTLPIPLPAYLLIFVVEATIVTLPFVIDRFASPRIGGALATLMFPMALVTAEFLRSRLTSGASWWSIAYSQYGFMPLMQVSAVVGIWGITFVVAWFASTSNWRGAAGSTGLTSAARADLRYRARCDPAAGSVRLMAAPTDRASIRTATLNRPIDLFAPGEMTRISEGRVSATEREPFKRQAFTPPRLVPGRQPPRGPCGRAADRLAEQSLLVFDDDEPAFLERAKSARGRRTGLSRDGDGNDPSRRPSPFRNKLVLIDPSASTVTSHLKNRPVAAGKRASCDAVTRDPGCGD
jgi:apolipoprotein N-acyltransferase